MQSPAQDVASNSLAIDLRLYVRNACNGLQQRFQHAEYFTCNPLISQSISSQFCFFNNLGFCNNLGFYKLSYVF